MLYVVTYMCTIVGVYSCAVDANQCVRSLRRVGCVGATICEVRLNTVLVVKHKQEGVYRTILDSLRSTGTEHSLIPGDFLTFSESV